jgi:hypothetical protein
MPKLDDIMPFVTPQIALLVLGALVLLIVTVVLVTLALRDWELQRRKLFRQLQTAAVDGSLGIACSIRPSLGWLAPVAQVSDPSLMRVLDLIACLGPEGAGSKIWVKNSP